MKDVIDLADRYYKYALKQKTTYNGFLFSRNRTNKTFLYPLQNAFRTINWETRIRTFYVNFKPKV